MTKHFDEIYVVTKNDYALFNNCVYDKKTAESVHAVALDSGYPESEVITLEKCMVANYLW